MPNRARAITGRKVMLLLRATTVSIKMAYQSFTYVLLLDVDEYCGYDGED